MRAPTRKRMPRRKVEWLPTLTKPDALFAATSGELDVALFKKQKSLGWLQARFVHQTPPNQRVSRRLIEKLAEAGQLTLVRQGMFVDQYRFASSQPIQKGA